MKKSQDCLGIRINGVPVSQACLSGLISLQEERDRIVKRQQEERDQIIKRRNKRRLVRVGGHNRFLTLTELRQRKKEIGWRIRKLKEEVEILALDILNVDKAITSLEEEHHLGVKEEQLNSRLEEKIHLEEEEHMEEDLAKEEQDDDNRTGNHSVTEGWDPEQQLSHYDSAAQEEEWLECVFANKWLGQDGDDSGIPKKYSPCRYFFNTINGCNRKECDFSHNEKIFRHKEFTALFENLSWGMKKRFCSVPRPPEIPPLKKHHQGSAMKKTSDEGV